MISTNVNTSKRLSPGFKDNQILLNPHIGQVIDLYINPISIKFQYIMEAIKAVRNLRKFNWQIYSDTYKDPNGEFESMRKKDGPVQKVSFSGMYKENGYFLNISNPTNLMAFELSESESLFMTMVDLHELGFVAGFFQRWQGYYTVIVRTTYNSEEEYAERFWEIHKFFLCTLGLASDPKGEDISVLTEIKHDQHARFNFGAVPFDVWLRYF